MAPYRFFFSYASETHRASEGRLEKFYDALCRRVALKAGSEIDKVAYIDRKRLTVATFWGQELVSALQNSHVLVALISPHYLNSTPCGREIEFFLRRFKMLGQKC